MRMHRLADGFCELACTGGHNARVTALAVVWQVSGAFEGPLAASGAHDGGLCVWDLLLDSGEPPHARLAGHSAAVASLEVRRGRVAALWPHEATGLGACAARALFVVAMRRCLNSL